MSSKTWSYFLNPFISAAASFKKALKISTYTDAQLQARSGDPFYAPLYKMYDPLHQALVDAYNNWKTQGGTQKGTTLTFDQLLTLLSPSKIGAWDYAVMGVYAKGTPGYISIFPQGHKPFQTGDKDQRVNAVQQLAKALAGTPALSTTMDDVNDFYKQLITARSAQQGNIGNTGSESDEVRDAVTAAMTGLYSVLGSCITQFADDPTQAEPIFDLETIRNHDQLVFTGGVKALETENIMEHTFASTDEIKLSATGTALGFYLSKFKDDAPGKYTVITELAGTNQTVKPADFGDGTNTFLHVINNDAATEGHYKVEL